MRDVFGEGVQAEIKHAEHHDYDNQEPEHHVKQDVGFAGRRYESRQMMRRRWIDCLRHRLLLSPFFFLSSLLLLQLLARARPRIHWRALQDDGP